MMQERQKIIAEKKPNKKQQTIWRTQNIVMKLSKGQFHYVLNDEIEACKDHVKRELFCTE